MARSSRRDRGASSGRLRARHLRGVCTRSPCSPRCGNACAELGYDAVPPAYAALRFSQVQDALAALPVDDRCVSFADARDVAARALTGAGLTDWEVARDGSFDGDDRCLSFWVFDFDQRLLYLFGTG